MSNNKKRFEVKSAAYQLGAEYGFLKTITPSEAFFEKTAAKTKINKNLLKAAFNKKAFAFLPYLAMAAMTAAPSAYDWWQKKKYLDPHKQRMNQRGPMGFGGRQFGGLDPRSMSNVMRWGAENRALGAQQNVIERAFR